MQITTRRHERRSARARSPRPPRPAALRDAPEPTAARRGGGPQDRALYSCACGYSFMAAVTTSVGCPHCGAEQAW